MAKYRVMCCKYGYADISAGSAEQAEEIAEQLPDSAYSWGSAEDHQTVEKVEG